MALSYLVWGGGGHGKMVADLIRAVGQVVLGYVDSDPRKLGEVVEPGGARVIVEESDLLEQLHFNRLPLSAAVGVVPAIGHNGVRYHCMERLDDLAAPALIHPAATVAPSVVVGAGTVVFPGSVVNTSTRIGRGVILNTGAIVEHDCVVDDGAHISPRATLCGDVKVGSRSWIGAAAVIVPGVRVGSDAVVGAGSVVLRDVAAGTTVVGNPARLLRAP